MFQEEGSNQPNLQGTDINFCRNNSYFVRNNTVDSCNFNDKFEESEMFNIPGEFVNLLSCIDETSIDLDKIKEYTSKDRDLIDLKKL